MADLVIGPMLRYVSDREATVWVETDGPCRVEVLGHRGDTFQVNARHTISPDEHELGMGVDALAALA